MSKVPPGLPENLVELFRGGDESWRACPPFKAFTNVFVCDRESGKILLGWKKRGFGKGMFNGFGGKVEPGETPIEAAARELKEEAGITAALRPCGILLFVNASQEYCHYVHIYRADEYEDEPIETEEMRPEWFSIPEEHRKAGVAADPSLESIPYDKMWADDRLWMPLLLKGQSFVGRVDFCRKEEQDGKDGGWEMERWWFGDQPGV